jgi:hypothetical protein
MQLYSKSSNIWITFKTFVLLPTPDLMENTQIYEIYQHFCQCIRWQRLFKRRANSATYDSSPHYQLITYMSKLLCLNLDVIWAMLRYWQWKQSYPRWRTGIPSAILYLPETQWMRKCHSEIWGSPYINWSWLTIFINPTLVEYATFKIVVYLPSNSCSYDINCFGISKYSVLLNCQCLMFLILNVIFFLSTVSKCYNNLLQILTCERMLEIGVYPSTPKHNGRSNIHPTGKDARGGVRIHIYIPVEISELVHMCVWLILARM